MTRKVLLICAIVCLWAQSAHAQALWNGLAPAQTASNPLQLRVSDGDLSSIFGTSKFSATNLLLTPSATNYIYLDLTQVPPVISVNTTGFPGSYIYKIAIAVTNTVQITSLTDSRPAFNQIAFSGVLNVATAPSGSCTNGSIPQMVISTGIIYTCQSGTWGQSAGGTPGGSPIQTQVNNSGVFGGTSCETFDVLSTGPERLKCDNVVTGPNPYVDIRAYGARTCNPSAIPCASGITASINSGLTAATVSNSSAFINGDGLVIYGAGGASTVTTPTGLTATPAIALGGTGASYYTTSATASTTRCYKVIAMDIGGGYSSASSETCTTTGQPTLGAVTVNLSSCSRSGVTVTCTTSSSHPLLVGLGGLLVGEAYIGGTISDNSFRGFVEVATAADSTHFTYINPTINTSLGAPASATGGTVTFYLNDLIQWTAVTNAWKYFIYEGASGAETLVGQSLPSAPPGSGGSNVQVTFEYYGTGLMSNQTFPPWIPTTPPSSASHGNLSTTVVSGGGTANLTLANAAGASVSGATVRLDAAPAIRAAGAAAGVNAPLYIPNDPSGKPFVVNSFVNLLPYQIAIYQSGNLWLNDTFAIGYAFAPVGTVRWTGGQNTAYGANGSFGSQPVVSVKEAYPGVYDGGGNDVNVDGVQFNYQGTNGALLFYVDGTGGAFNDIYRNANFATSTSSSDYMGFGLYISGVSGIFLDKITLSNGNGQDGASHNSPFFCNSCGDTHIQDGYMVHRGILYFGASGGPIFTIGTMHYNGGGTPLITSNGANVVINVGATIMDTVGHQCVAALGSNRAYISNNNCAPSGYSPFDSPSVTGTSVQGISGGLGKYNNSLAYPVGTNSQRESDNAQTIDYNFVGPGAVTASYLDSFIINNQTPSAPTCSINSGGSITVGAWAFQVQPIWWNGMEGVPSALGAGCSTTSGNQSITINWSAISGGPQTYHIYGALNGSGSALACTTAALTCTITSNPSFSNGVNTVPLGGPTMLMPGVQGVATPQVVYGANGGFNATSSAATLSANRTEGLPDASGYFAVSSTTETSALTGQSLVSNNGGASSFLSPGITDGNSGAAITSTPYTIQCDSASALIDRAKLLRFQSGAAAVTVPLSTASGCGSGFTVSVVNDGAGILTFSRSSPDTFSVFSGISNTDGAISFTLNSGQFATLNQGASGIWEVRITSGGLGAGAEPLATGHYALSNFCPPSNAGNCYYSAVNTQVNMDCTWGTGSATITCGTQMAPVTGSVNGSNVATYSLQTNQGTPPPVNTAWAIGDSVTVLGFTGGDTFFNQTCTLTAVTTTSVSCALTHAAASSTTNGLVVNTSKGPFVAGDVGKTAWGAGSTAGGVFSSGCDPYQPQPISAFITGTHSTISTYISSTQITLNANPTNAFTTPVSGGCFVWGTPDDTGAAAVDAALQVSASCPKLDLQAGYYLFTAPHFFTTPRACLEHPNVFDSIRYGNIFFAAGFEWAGRGAGPTTIWIPPDFPETGSCANGYKASACFTVTGEGYVHDLTITGGANGGMPTNTSLMAVGVGSLEHFNCTGVGANVSGTYGVDVQLQAQLQQVNVSACGNSNIHIDASTGNIFAGSPIANAKGYRVSADNAEGADIYVDSGANFTCHSCLTFGTQNSGGASGWYNLGGTLWLEDIDSTQIAAVTGTIAVQTAYNSSGATSVLHCSRCRFGQGSVATQTNGIQCAAAATCNNYLEDSLIAATGIGKPYQDSSNALSTLYQIGQTTKFSGGGSNSISGANRHIEVGTCTFASSTTCSVTFAQTFGGSGNVPAFTIPPNIVGTATTLTVSALSSTGATITASASNSGSVNWMAILQ